MSEVRYRRLPQHDEHAADSVDNGQQEEFLPEQFTKQPVQVPWKAVIYAVVLFLAGTVLLVIGSLIVTGHLDPIEHNDRFWPLILLGSIMFIPGSYHTYYAYKAFSGDPDWDFEEYPDF